MRKGLTALRRTALSKGVVIVNQGADGTDVCGRSERSSGSTEGSKGDARDVTSLPPRAGGQVRILGDQQ